MIQAKILLDSTTFGENASRLTTWKLTYPRFIHSEFMTHRVFSRNAASSRAIPIERMIDRVLSDPAIPIHIGKNQKGMQAETELSGDDRDKAIEKWIEARDAAIFRARQMMKLGVHKQVVNRLLEPWLHIEVIATATDHENFFAQRCHKDAQPEFRELATQMLRMYLSNKPTFLHYGEWHIPMLLDDDMGLPVDTKLKVATGRCARISYLTHEGKRDIEEDIRLHNDLMSPDKEHWSPFEHCAMAVSPLMRHGNLQGWMQYRKKFLNENKTFDYSKEIA
jgi:thymidylate synthase ThyX